jgi:hypothetical protein
MGAHLCETGLFLGLFSSIKKFSEKKDYSFSEKEEYRQDFHPASILN